MTTIVQFVPQWLRARFQKPGTQKPKPVSKKQRQALPTLANLERPPGRLQDDDSPPGYRIRWLT